MSAKILSEIQRDLKAPKGQFNNFGKYKYRSCEDIVEAVKPLLAEHGAHLTLSDEIIGLTDWDRVYVKATATITFEDGTTVQTTAFAREPETKKGMDDSQITGTASSYARKYALNGLLAIDDTKDADTDEHRNQTTPSKGKPNKTILDNIAMTKTLEELQGVWFAIEDDKRSIYLEAKDAAKARIQGGK
jgi:hypothetical protein